MWLLKDRNNFFSICMISAFIFTDKYAVVSRLFFAQQSSLCCIPYFKRLVGLVFSPSSILGIKISVTEIITFLLSFNESLSWTYFISFVWDSEYFSSMNFSPFSFHTDMKEHKWLNPATCLQYHAFRWIFFTRQRLHYVHLMSLVLRYWIMNIHCNLWLFYLLFSLGE